MLATVPFVDNGVQRLSQEVTYFFKSIRAATRWSRSMFSRDFYDVVVSRSPGLKQRFRELWHSFSLLTDAQKGVFCDEYMAHNEVEALCNGQGQLSKQWKTMSEKLRNAATDLFSFMYEQTLNSESFREFSGVNLRDHYLAFRAAYAHQMCPFCGLEDYVDIGPEVLQRDHYDHYLHRSAYPFAAINFHNLYPMCHHCNSSFKKANEVLFCSATGKRRRAPFPQADRFELRIHLDRALEPEPLVHVELVPTDPVQDSEKFESWKDFLSIVPRYQAKICSKKAAWLSEIIAETQGNVDAQILVVALTRQRDIIGAAAAVAVQSETVVRIPFLEHCVQKVESLAQFFASEPRFKNYLLGRAIAFEHV